MVTVNELMWFLTRSSGVVALVLIAAAVIDGVLFSGRATGRWRRPNWWMDLHRGLGGYALAFTVLHLLTAYGADIGVGLATLVVPGAATESTTAYTLGVLATWAIALAVVTSWPRRRLPRRLWHVLHVLTIPAAVLAGVHAQQLGSDALSGWYTVVLLVLVATVSYAVAIRLTGAVARRSAVHRRVEPAGDANGDDRAGDVAVELTVDVGNTPPWVDDRRLATGGRSRSS